MKENLKELEELKSGLEAFQRFNKPALDRAPTIANPLDQAVKEAQRIYRQVAETNDGRRSSSVR